MAKTTCADCGGTKGKSSSYSYCRDCVNARSRERYANLRLAEGHVVQSRNAVDAARAKETRRAHLLSLDGKPGTCEACNHPEPRALQPIYIGNRFDEDALYNAGDVHSLVCQACRYLTKVLTSSSLEQILLLNAYLTRNDLTLEQILPELQEVITGTAPPLLQPEQ